ncbi:hypothetical protein OUZ56_018639 [Daphnia magna]|uniref:Uncharacterized protein n=1 Tax=Daphnia magna TaxID=35525 RepID=A0ABQ9Z9E5_9CRUS|nr:hypothetical protein OUZ56_018639 [Daphnia magna]
MEIIHIMDKQATVLKESLWESRPNAQLIRELRGQFASLQSLDDTFEALNQILQWLHQLADSLNIEFSLLANGHLAPQIVSPV